MAKGKIRSALSVCLCLSVCLSCCLSVDLLFVALIIKVKYFKAMFFRRCWTLKFFKDLSSDWRTSSKPLAELVKVIDALAVQVGLLQGLWSSKIASLDCSGLQVGGSEGLWGSKLSSLGRLGPSGWSLGPLGASKLASWKGFKPPS